jgi:muramoyltetrapeptide carboxypeptidase
MNTLKPPKLNTGDTIGIVAPCLPVLSSFRKDYERGKQMLTNMGFKLKEGKTITATPHRYASATPEEQAADINAMFADPKVKAIISAVGGHSAITVLPHLDYDLIRKRPKPFIGMSNMTVYHLAIYTQTGMVGFHMDEVTFGLGVGADKYAQYPEFKQAYMDVLTLDKPLGVLPHVADWKSWRDGTASGCLIGGNLSSISHQIGTPYFPKPEDFDGAILFWEAIGQSKADIMQVLHQLKYYGVLEQISGMLIGTVTDIPSSEDKEINEPELRDIVLDVTKEYEFPIMAGVDFGHYTINLPMPIGIKASFDTSKLELSLKEGAVS